LGGRGRWISEFQDSQQGYTEKPCLEKTKKRKKKNFKKNTNTTNKNPIK
jgi:hypothetical protein